MQNQLAASQCSVLFAKIHLNTAWPMQLPLIARAYATTEGCCEVAECSPEARCHASVQAKQALPAHHFPGLQAGALPACFAGLYLVWRCIQVLPSIIIGAEGILQQMAVAVAASLPFVYVDKLYFALGSTSFWVVVTVGAQQNNAGPTEAKPRNTESQVGTATFCAAILSVRGNLQCCKPLSPIWRAGCHTCVTALRHTGYYTAPLQRRC